MGAIGASDGVPEGQVHLAALAQALAAVDQELSRIEAWGAHLAGVLGGGGRLLASWPQATEGARPRPSTWRPSSWAGTG